jgi:hypothetical protein
MIETLLANLGDHFSSVLGNMDLNCLTNEENNNVKKNYQWLKTDKFCNKKWFYVTVEAA